MVYENGIRKTFKTTFMATAITLNILGGFIAVMLKLPVFIDTIGTILVSFIFGPICGAIVGLTTSLINGFTFDYYSLYFLPVQVLLGLVCGSMYKIKLFEGKRIILSTIISALLSSIISSIIAAYVFSGITSSGTTFVVMYLKNLGFNIITSVFSTQIIFDLIDKFLVISIALKLRKIFAKKILGGIR